MFKFRCREIRVLYPPVDLKAVEIARQRVNSWAQLSSQFKVETEELRPREFVLSLNRYERKKDIGQAIRAIHWIKLQVYHINRIGALINIGRIFIISLILIIFLSIELSFRAFHLKSRNW